ncbi:MAG: DUF4177 domain-containing protein [Ruminococcus sp.]|nr:DUF4177 domain-containing protein [Ruminococcus sp.]
MKEYKFIRMKHSIFKGYVSESKKYKKLGHREIIKNMAEQGWRFVGQVPVEALDIFAYSYKFDLVFEKDE